MRAIVLVSLVLVGGCAEMARQKATEARDQAFAACKARYVEEPGHYRERVACMVDARDEYFAKADPRDTDLNAVLDAEQMRLAEQVDAGRLSIADAKLSSAKIASICTSQARQRSAEDTAVQTQRAIAESAQADAIAQILRGFKPPTTTCSSVSLLPGQVTTTCNN